MATTKKQPEQYIKNAILEWLMWQPGLMIIPKEKINVYSKTAGRFLKGKGNETGKSTVWRLGVPDILVLGYKIGSLALEVKTPKGVLNPNQKAFMAEAKVQEVKAYVVTSVDDVITIFRKMHCPV